MRPALLIANPSASGFTGAGFRRVLQVLSETFDVEPEWPHSTHETRAIASSAAAKGFEVVFAMGGDGVAHHVANGLVGTDAALGLIPSGTTNVLARIFGLPTKPHKAARALSHLPSVPTRLARIQQLDGLASTYATFSVGVGFDAAVVDVAERRPHSKVSFGGLHFASTAVSRLIAEWRASVPNLRVDCDGRRMDAVSVLAQVHRPYTYFGKLPLHITSHPTAGMAAAAVDDLAVRRASEIVTRAVLGRPFPERLGMTVWTNFDRLTIEADPPTPFQADGELLGITDGIHITPEEDALLVLREDEALTG